MRHKRRLLITGASGFIGANLAHSYVEAGYEIHAFIRVDSDLWRLRTIKKRIHFHIVDLTDRKAVAKAVSGIKPHLVFHCASYGGHMDSQTDGRRIIDTNYFGTMNLVDACLAVDFRCFINTGSSSEYGEVAGRMREDRAPEPSSAYAASKAAATLYCGYIARTHNRPITTLRLFSPFGYSDSEDRLIPKVIGKALRNPKSIELYSATAVRDFIFIEDVVNAYRKTVVRSSVAGGKIFNIASGKQRSVKEVVSCILKTVDAQTAVTYNGTGFKQREPKSWRGDISAARRQLGWSPEIDFVSAIGKTVDWYRANSSLYDR